MNRVCPPGAGVWATLQFKWVQMQYPVVVVAFEKLLLGGCLPVAATVQGWGIIAAMGLAAAPFYLAPILAVLYCLFAMPLPSSFAAASRKKSIGRLCMCHLCMCHLCLCHLCMCHLCMCHRCMCHLYLCHLSCVILACVTFACVTFACVTFACTTFACGSFACVSTVYTHLKRKRLCDTH